MNKECGKNKLSQIVFRFVLDFAVPIEQNHRNSNPISRMLRLRRDKMYREDAVQNGMIYFFHVPKWATINFVIWIVCGLVSGQSETTNPTNPPLVQPGIILHLDKEELDAKGQAINPSTQSINRYSSILRELNRLNTVDLNEGSRQISFNLGSEKLEHQLFVKNIDVSFLVPLLPYPRDAKLDDFDRANLMLAEYARNGIELSYQTTNSLFGFFNGSDKLFEGEEEYFFKDGAITPNKRLKPLRFKITNNCLNPGLWELSASDSVGEMYHSWFTMPQSTYHNMIRQANHLQMSDDQLADALDYRKDLSGVSLKLEKLRTLGKRLLSAKPRFAGTKKIGGYSSQDSRRKVQRKYFEILRNGNVIQPANFSDLKEGDIFKLKKFVPPGIYSGSESEQIPFNPSWSKVVIQEVNPLTQYPGGQSSADESGHIEITLYEEGERKGVVMGNIPIALLVEQADYRIPAFGVGVLLPSEPIERRYLRLKEGPVPYYAYQIEKGEQGWHLLNNHEQGLEQIFLRPFEQDNSLYLRITLVSYERIVDLMELEVPLKEELAERIKAATKVYQPPLFRVYEDANLF